MKKNLFFALIAMVAIALSFGSCVVDRGHGGYGGGGYHHHGSGHYRHW